jgi:hypothetical protein
LSAWQIVQEILSRKNPSQKGRAGGVAQCVGPEFKPQYHIKKKKKKKKQEMARESKELRKFDPEFAVTEWNHLVQTPAL